ncbi:hypothetical protein SAP269_21060 [Spiroplasma ixodetis]|uniref:Spiroplasmavirus-related protein n=1 Tax=Spiroplasma ixodetis TaxID=2141 RepID=A0ABM8JQN3_9MOLU
MFKKNLYRNTFCKVKPIINKINQSLFEDWNNYSELNKEIKSWELYCELFNFIIVINLILNKKSL